MIKHIDPERIDYADYLNSYTDLRTAFGEDLELAKQHWIEHGKDEGRHVRIKDVDYRKVVEYVLDKHISTVPVPDSDKINVITSLYVETDPTRLKEYCITLELNLQNPYIRTIYVYYDTSGGECSDLDEILMHRKIKVIPGRGRPSFGELIDIAKGYDRGVWCIANGDIVLTDDLGKLAGLDLYNIVVALTRWNFVSETEISVYHEKGYENTISQDVWIFDNTTEFPLGIHNYKVGEVACDCRMSVALKQYGIWTLNIWDEIKTLHIHFANCRRQDYEVTDILHAEFGGVWPRVFRYSIQDVKNASVTGFIHLATMNHWEEVLEEQLRLVKESGLYDKTYRIHVIAVSDDRSKVQIRDPKVQVTYAGGLDEYEFATLREIKDHARKNGGLVWYLHSKGVSIEGDLDWRSLEKWGDWRQYMQYYLVERHEECIEALKDHDCCGVEYRKKPAPHFSGNFWWATCEHIRHLPELEEARVDSYYDFLKYTHLGERHKAEYWLFMRRHTTYKDLHNLGADIVGVERIPRSLYEQEETCSE